MKSDREMAWTMTPSSKAAVVGEQSRWSFANHFRECRQEPTYPLIQDLPGNCWVQGFRCICQDEPAHGLAYKLHAVRLPFPASREKLPRAYRLLGSSQTLPLTGFGIAGESSRA
jgi:hypothetical protein